MRNSRCVDLDVNYSIFVDINAELAHILIQTSLHLSQDKIVFWASVCFYSSFLLCQNMRSLKFYLEVNLESIFWYADEIGHGKCYWIGKLTKGSEFPLRWNTFMEKEPKLCWMLTSMASTVILALSGYFFSWLKYWTRWFFSSRLHLTLCNRRIGDKWNSDPRYFIFVFLLMESHIGRVRSLLLSSPVSYLLCLQLFCFKSFLLW